MDKNTTNAVRQVMMNELGLTRESIRAEMVSIVEKTVQNHMHSINFEKMFEKFINTTLSDWYCNKDTLAKLVRQIVADTVTDKVLKELRIDGVLNINTGKEG